MNITIKKEVQRLRRKGKTYSEIQKIIGRVIPKATLSYWCRCVALQPSHRDKIIEMNARNLAQGREKRIQLRKEERALRFRMLHQTFDPIIRNLDTYQKKLLLAVLYLGEGGKHVGRSALMFGNSDPKIITLFLGLLREVYRLDENKFRCTVQCRADQTIRNLEKYWSAETKIPLSNFYAARVDKRSINKKTCKEDYHGVLRIDYFSAALFHELMDLSKIVSGGR